MFRKCVKPLASWSHLCADLNVNHIFSRTCRLHNVHRSPVSTLTAPDLRLSRGIRLHMAACACLSPTRGSSFRSAPLRFRLDQGGAPRCVSTTTILQARLKPEEVRKRVDDLTDRFAEARELLGDARESLGTTYFSDDMTDAQEAVAGTLAAYEALLAELEQDQREDVVRTIGLRMEELRAQEQAIKDLLD